MFKKAIILLFGLSSATFANTPIRHRVAMPKPDLLATPAAIQERVAQVLTPSLPTLQTESVLSSVSHFSAAIANDLIEAAKQHLGARYSRGSMGPKAFDCSGFTSYVFKRMGITLKRSSREQVTQGEAVTCKNDLQPGDLVFFGHGGRNSKRVSHVGIVTNVDAETGLFNFIHASTSRGVRIDRSDDSYWSPRYVAARRLLGVD